MVRATVFNLELSARQASRDDERSSLDSIGNDCVLGGAECFHAFDLNRV